MNIAWHEIQERHDALAQQLLNPSLDSQKRHELQKEFAMISNVLAKHNEIVELEKQRDEAQAQITAADDAEMKELFEQEVSDLQEKVIQRSTELDDLLFPSDPMDDRAVFLEIRAGAGGQEAALFVADLLKMYNTYAVKKGWRFSLENFSSTDLGGYKDVVAYISGHGVYGHLKYESGVHRVQRVPATETQGRVHTSTVTVAVLPEAEEVDVVIDPSDLRIDVFRAGGAGGQHVNTTDSAVRVTHIPTGVVVSCQDERSQHKNKAKALKELKSRILAAQIEKKHEEMAKTRKDLVGLGMRSEKIRTYNYPQNRISDHRVGLTLKNLDYVMTGDVDEIIQALRKQDREDRKQEAFTFGK